MLDRLQDWAVSAWLKNKAVCSFCRKAPDEAGPLIEGPGSDGAGGVYICEECAAFATSIFDRRRSEADRSVS